MTQDEIIEMAKLVGEGWWADDLDLEFFAGLIAQYEREACAKVCDEIATEDGFEGSYAYRCVQAIRARGQA
jgi:hypothetical protein